MRWVARVASGAAVLTILMVTWSAAALAGQADSGLGLELRSAQSAYGASEPVRLTLTVTNAGAERLRAGEDRRRHRAGAVGASRRAGTVAGAQPQLLRGRDQQRHRVADG